MDSSGDVATGNSAVKSDNVTDSEDIPSLEVIKDEVHSPDLPGETADAVADDQDESNDGQSHTIPNGQLDTSFNAEPDITPKAESDTSPAEPDTNLAEPDTSLDAEPDTSPDVEPDTSPDVEPDTRPDVEPDASSEFKPDTSPNNWTKESSDNELEKISDGQSYPNDISGQSSDDQLDQSSEALLQQTASDIVENAIMASPPSLQSNGDFSMLNDAEQFLTAAKEQEKTVANSNEESDEMKPEDEKDKDPSKTSEENEDAEQFLTTTKEQEKTVTNSNEENDKMKPEAEKDEEPSKTSEENNDEWMDVFGNGLLKKKVVTPGQGQQTRPQKDEKVTISVETFLMDESVYEAKKELQFVIGDIEMPYAIEFSVNLMELKEKCKVVSDKKYCVRQDGGPVIEVPHDQLVYIIELLDVQGGPYSASTPIQKRLEWVEKKRNLGNYIYTNNEFELANVAYKKCLLVLDKAEKETNSDETNDDIKRLSLKCHNNQSATLMKLGLWKEAKEACGKAEEIDPRNIKTLYRKGKILSELGQSKESIAALKKANLINPEDKTILNELNKQQKRLEQENKKHMGMCKKMLGDFAKKSGEEKVLLRKEESRGFWSKNSMMMGGSLAAISVAVLLGFYLMHK